MTPYERHQQRNHQMTRYSPNGVDIIEECTNCGARWLHNPAIGYPVTLRPKDPGANATTLPYHEARNGL